MMIFREISFGKDLKAIAFAEEDSQDHDSNMYSVIGCPEGLASILIDVAYLAGDHGFDGFSDQLSIPLHVTTTIHQILLDLAVWKPAPKFKCETGESHEMREYLCDCWKYGILYYIYSVFYREPIDSPKLELLRQNILGPIRKYPAVVTKQLLWPFYIVSSELPASDRSQHIYCLDVVDSWLKATNGTGMFITINDLLLETWSARKRSNGMRWWDVLKCKLGRDGEALFT
jgi:hypothetical protein